MTRSPLVGGHAGTAAKRLRDGGMGYEEHRGLGGGGGGGLGLGGLGGGGGRRSIGGGGNGGGGEGGYGMAGVSRNEMRVSKVEMHD